MGAAAAELGYSRAAVAVLLVVALLLTAAPATARIVSTMSAVVAAMHTAPPPAPLACGFRRNGALHPKVLAHLFRPIWRGWWGRGLGASATVGLPSHLLRVVWLLSLPGRGVSWSFAVMISHVRSRRCSATRQAGEQ
jgi:hypothetical protein